MLNTKLNILSNTFHSVEWHVTATHFIKNETTAINQSIHRWWHQPIGKVRRRNRQFPVVMTYLNYIECAIFFLESVRVLTLTRISYVSTAGYTAWKYVVYVVSNFVMYVYTIMWNWYRYVPLIVYWFFFACLTNELEDHELNYIII